ncbi:MAG: hypothetical protein AABX34_06755, partial [Nanoarchaeota archaeon]
YKKESTIFLCFAFFFPLAFALILSYTHPIVTVFQIKQLIYIIPVFLILASVGCFNTKYSKAIIIAIAMLSIVPIHAYYANVDKTQFREAVDFMKGNELILVHKKSAQATFKYYYGEKPNVIGVADPDEMKSNLKNVDSFWMLFTSSKYSQYEKAMKEELLRTYRITETKNFYEIDLIHYKKK